MIVETAIAVGGVKLQKGINLYCFPNRMPSLHSNVKDIFQCIVNKVSWATYCIDPKEDCAGVFVSWYDASTALDGNDIGYSKDDLEDIAAATKGLLEQCCIDLRGKISDITRLQTRQTIVKTSTAPIYVPYVISAFSEILDNSSFPDCKRHFSQSGYFFGDMKSRSPTTRNQDTKRYPSDLEDQQNRVGNFMKGNNVDEEIVKEKLIACMIRQR